MKVMQAARQTNHPQLITAIIQLWYTFFDPKKPIFFQSIVIKLFSLGSCTSHPPNSLLPAMPLMQLCGKSQNLKKKTCHWQTPIYVLTLQHQKYPHSLAILLISTQIIVHPYTHSTKALFHFHRNICNILQSHIICLWLLNKSVQCQIKYPHFWIKIICTSIEQYMHEERMPEWLNWGESWCFSFKVRAK